MSGSGTAMRADACTQMRDAIRLAMSVAMTTKVEPMTMTDVGLNSNRNDTRKIAERWIGVKEILDNLDGYNVILLLDLLFIDIY